MPVYQLPESAPSREILELALMIERCKEEIVAMTGCAKLNPSETGGSIYMQMAILAEKRMAAFIRTRNALLSAGQ